MKTLVEKFLESYKFNESEDSNKIYAIITRYDNAEWYNVDSIIHQPTVRKLAEEWYKCTSYGPDDVTSIMLYEVTPKEAAKLKEISKKGSISSKSDPDFQYLDNFYDDHSEIAYLCDIYCDGDYSDFKEWIESWYYDGPTNLDSSEDEDIDKFINHMMFDHSNPEIEIRYFQDKVKELNLGIPDGDLQ